MCAAMALFIANDAIVKMVSGSLPGMQLIFLRGLMASLLMLVVCAVNGVFKADAATGHSPLRQLLNRTVVLRAALDATASNIYLTALFHMPLANATAINMATPLFITLMAVHRFGETVNRTRWLAIGAGFVGVLLIVQPAAEGFNAWALLCLLGTVLHAARDLLTRLVPPSMSSLLITLTTVTAVTALSGGISLFQGWAPFSVLQWLQLSGASVMLSGGYFLLIRAMRRGEMNVIAPFRYSGLLFALLLGWLIWGEIPNTLALAGIGLLLGAGLYMVKR